MTAPRTKYETRWITPDSAREYLDNQVENRPLSRQTIHRYAADMLGGDWLVTGENIKLNTEGRMLDGQHRMHAIIHAGKLAAEAPEEHEPFTGMFLDFALGIDDNARQSMDIGRRRSLADEMSFEGGDNAGRVAPLVSWHLAFLHGNFTNAGGSWRPTQAQALAAWRQDKTRYYTSAMRGYDASKQGMGAAAAFSTAYHVIRCQHGDELADRFWDLFVTGANMSVGHPILMLRNLLMRKKFRRKELLGLVFKTWNSWIDGRVLKDSPYFKTELTNKNFPQPRNPADKKVPNPEFAGDTDEDDQ